MTTLNLGLIDHDELPSLTKNDIARMVYNLITTYPSIEFPEITMQHRANYQEVQSDKEVLKDLERYIKYPNQEV